MAITAPQPAQPTASEIANWSIGRGNYRQSYNDQLARSTHGRNQANLAYNAGVRNLGFQQGQERQGFDDPYIGRGMLHSGVRNQGLSNFYTGYQNQREGLATTLANQVGNYDLEDTLAHQQQMTGLRNIDMQEQARRSDLASEIRGII